MNDIVFGKEQALLLGVAAKFFREKSSVEVVRDLIETETDFEEEVWVEMVDAGWNGMVIAEEHGGTGFGMTELVTVVEPMGRHLFGSPFLSTQLVIQALLKGGAGLEALRENWLPRLAAGRWRRSQSWKLTATGISRAATVRRAPRMESCDSRERSASFSMPLSQIFLRSVLASTMAPESRSWRQIASRRVLSLEKS